MTERYRTLVQQMRDDTLHACDFSHADHIGAAFQALEEEPFFEALALFARGIEGAAARAGAGDKFNATITLVFMSVIAERQAGGRYADAADFIARNTDLSERDLLARWYTPARLSGTLARHVALLPDRAIEHV